MDAESITMKTTSTLRPAIAKLYCLKNLKIIPGATHLFEERGKLEEVAQISAHWFSQHMTDAGKGSETSWKE